MHIKKVRIKNYKSLRQTNEIEFGDGFNVIIGQNSSGKTALLESLKYPIFYKPYRGVQILPDQALNPKSQVEMVVVENGSQIKRDLLSLSSAKDFFVPLKIEGNPTSENIRNYAANYFIDDILHELQLSYQATESGAEFIGIDSAIRKMHFNKSEDRQSLIFKGATSVSRDDSTVGIRNNLNKKIYVFKAERLNISRSHLPEDDYLKSNAENLPSVLFRLQTNGKMPKLIDHIKYILPNVKYVTLGNQQNNQIEIKIWPVDPDSGRADLAVTLEETGTGVGQVLAILYVAMTQPESVIVIDEPNSFLHPGASKKLIEVLRLYKNQYIISTHAPELILAANPSTIHLIQLKDGESVVERLDGEALVDTRLVLNEVGVGLSEVFGAENIIWVEGPTEKECFPKIYKTIKGKVPLGISFVSLHNTSDLEVKSKSTVVWEIYRRLSEGNALVPPAIAFSFDREKRSDQHIQDMTRASDGKVKFLPRRLLENYFIHPQAICDVLNDSILDENKKVTSESVMSWLIAKCSSQEYVDRNIWNGDISHMPWLQAMDGANLLKDLFAELSDSTVEFRKTKHSVALADWLLINDRKFINELVDYVSSLIPPKPL